MAANCFHNHCQCNYIIVLGIGVTWHSHMSNASKGCVMELAASCEVTQDPGEDASTRYDSTKLGACTLVIHHSVFSPQK